VNVPHFSRYAISFCAAATALPGCGPPPTDISLGTPAAPAIERATGGGCPCLYVLNDTNNNPSITVYGMGASGNVSPIRTISGSHTGLDGPADIAVDRNQNIYVTDPPAEYVTVYGSGASGNVFPTQVIGGPKTLLSVPAGIAVDAAGNIYVANAYRLSGPQRVTIYAPGANGNVAPTRIIEGFRTKLDDPEGLALDSGGNLYATNYFINSSVTVYPPGASGNVKPIRIISGRQTRLSAPRDIGLDATANIYVVNSAQPDGPITIYAPGSKRDVKPSRTLQGKKTMLDYPTGTAVDPNQELYVANALSNAITVYAAGGSGNVTPIRTISGSNTGLDGPSGIAIH